MEAVVIITALALMQFFFFGIQVVRTHSLVICALRESALGARIYHDLSAKRGNADLGCDRRHKIILLVASRYIAEIWRCSNVVCRSIL